MESWREVARRFFPPGHSIYDASGSPGYSGSAFARVETSQGAWLLRRWPAGLREEALRFVHRALAESRSQGFTGVPVLTATEDGETIVRYAGRLYDAQSFLAGKPVFAQSFGQGPIPNVAVRVSAKRLALLAEALARFHRSTSWLSPDLERRTAPLTERLRGLRLELEGYRETLARAAERESEEGKRTAQRWPGLLPSAVEAACKVAEVLPATGTSEVLGVTA